MPYRMTVTIRPICYFDGRQHELPSWLNQRKAQDGSVDILADQVPDPACDSMVGELLGAGEDRRQVATGRVLVVGELLLAAALPA